MPTKEFIADKDDPPSNTGTSALKEEGLRGSSSSIVYNGHTTEVDDFGLSKKRMQRPESFVHDRTTQDESQRERDRGHDSKLSRASSISSVKHHVNGTGDATGSPPDVSTTVPATLIAKSLHEDVLSHPSDSTHSIGTTPEKTSGAAGDSLPASNDTAVVAAAGISGWSHQVLAPHKAEAENQSRDDEWQDMPAFAPYDLYDDDGKLIAKEAQESDDEGNAYAGLGGAGKGYTRVQVDEDARSATSMDDNTSYLFKNKGTDLPDEDEEQRDPLAQMQATKDLLTEGQRIAYVGVTRLAMVQMAQELDNMDHTKTTKKEFRLAVESVKMWSQQMMLRLYAHMEIDSSEQVMIEQLAEHGVQPADLTPALMQNSRVKNPMAESSASNRQSVSASSLNDEERGSVCSSALAEKLEITDTSSPPPYVDHEGVDMPEVRTPSQLPTTTNIDIDLRWTVLCDLFLVLIADSIYDSRSRVLLERVGAALEVSWVEICRFEKRVTDALEMQEAANKETWDEAEHMENRRKLALKRKYMMMGLATVGGSLVIGLSAGLLAPVIGAGLAAGFTTIGVAGTSGFLAGAGGTALITSGAVVTGGTIAVRASHRRTGAVQTFEYRPLHNNKRVNLIVSISGWMNGKIDDVRLPYSTVDPIMGDIYSVLWEPEMLQSMGDTINILATEALTQSIQQVLGSTILVALMASLQLPIVLTKLSYLIDNPWTVSLGRANAAGLILADSLIDRNLGARPITLVGFSLGSRVIFSCLRELANRGALGLVQNVYLFGSPIVANKDDYLRARMVVAGRFVNGYASNDWILGYLFRATSGGIMRVAGLAPVEGIHGLENIDVTSIVNGHMAYRAAMPRLLREVGWEVDSDEFTEIEDPDPENHERRQRELIRELDEARKDAEMKPEKKRFGFFKRGKLAEKRRWEMYDDSAKEGGRHGTHGDGGSSNVLFDIEAIKAELASEQIEVKQLESTLPPMQLNLNGTDSSSDSNLNHPPLRETKSYDSSMVFRPKVDADASQTSLPTARPPNPFNQGYDDYSSYRNSESHNGSREDIKMSFDTNPRHSPSPSAGLSVPAQDPFATSLPHSQLNAPPSSATVPASIHEANIEHNAWLDDEDEDFGKEKQVTMSFA
ncbi:hypothetical protein MMC22_007284 [Lobaria immixta]|nr:hypothetical protein [Lobaria immixta]